MHHQAQLHLNSNTSTLNAPSLISPKTSSQGYQYRIERRTVFLLLLVRIDTGVFRRTVSNLSAFLNFFKYIYMKNIKIRLNTIYLD